ncbi:MAG: site-specific integrase [Mobilitalea sp.]
MQSNKSCQIVEQYLAYLITIKGRSKNTVLEYRLDLLQFFHFVDISRSQEHMEKSFPSDSSGSTSKPKFILWIITLPKN